MNRSAWFNLGLGLMAVFWALGAYNRLTRLRSQVGSAYAALSQQLVLREAAAARLAEGLMAGQQTNSPAQQSEQAAREQARLARDAVGTRLYDSATVAAMDTALHAHANSLQRLAQQANAVPTVIATNPLLINVGDALSAADGASSLACARYNDSVLAYNRAAAQFPALLLAWLFHFRPGTTLQAAVLSQGWRPARAPFEPWHAAQ